MTAAVVIGVALVVYLIGYQLAYWRGWDAGYRRGAHFEAHRFKPRRAPDGLGPSGAIKQGRQDPR